MTARAPSTKYQDGLAYPPRGMCADRAAAYCDLSKTKFLEGVESGTWPQPKDAGGAPRWDRLELDAAWDTLDQRKKKASARRKTLEELLEAEDGQGESSIHQ
jgi:hypothetical protein